MPPFHGDKNVVTPVEAQCPGSSLMIFYEEKRDRKGYIRRSHVKEILRS